MQRSGGDTNHQTYKLCRRRQHCIGNNIKRPQSTIWFLWINKTKKVKCYNVREASNKQFNTVQSSLVSYLFFSFTSPAQTALACRARFWPHFCLLQCKQYSLVMDQPCPPVNGIAKGQEHRDEVNPELSTSRSQCTVQCNKTWLTVPKAHLGQINGATQQSLKCKQHRRTFMGCSSVNMDSVLWSPAHVCALVSCLPP